MAARYRRRAGAASGGHGLAAHLAARLGATAALSLAAVALWLQLEGVATEQPRLSAPALAGRAFIASWILVTAAAATVALIGVRPTSSRPSAPGLLGAPLLISALGALLIASFTLDAPWRLASNLLCYLVISLPLVWVVARSAGHVAATDAALSLCAFAIVPAVLNTPRPTAALEFEPASMYRWSTGLPTSEWRLAHEVRLERPLGDTPIELLVWLARQQDGDARLIAWLNGRELGPLREEDYNMRVVSIPRELSLGQSTLRFEVAATSIDRTLRVLAHPWPGGATAQREASSYFDGLRWSQGTFNDLARRPQAGIYVITVRGLWR